MLFTSAHLQTGWTVNLAVSEQAKRSPLDCFVMLPINRSNRMNLIICTVAGVVLPFCSGILLVKGKTLLSFIGMNTGVYFAIAAVGIASSAT